MMISPSPPSIWSCSRRALARTSSTPVSLESSTYSGACDSRWQASRIFGQRCSATLPAAQVLALDPRLRGDEALGQLGLGHLQREQRHRRGRRATAFSAMLATSADLPIDGRAAITIRLPGLKAAGLLVDVLEARRRAGQRRLGDRQPVQLVGLLVAGCRAIERISFWRSSWATSSTERSARSTSSRAGASRDSTLAWISYEVVSSARICALSRTIRPYSRAWPAAGTQPASSSIASGPADLVELAVLAQRLGDRQRGRSCGRSRAARASPRTPRRAARGRSARAAGAPRPAARTGAARRAAPRRAPTSRPRGCAAGRRWSGRRSSAAIRV